MRNDRVKRTPAHILLQEISIQSGLLLERRLVYFNSRARAKAKMIVFDSSVTVQIFCSFRKHGPGCVSGKGAFVIQVTRRTSSRRAVT